MDLIKIYNRLPIFIQNLALTFEGHKIQKLRYGKDFRRSFHDFMSRNQWSYEQKCKYRDKQLVKMIEHCYKTVPYYKKTFDALGIDYRSIKCLEDLKILPVINKQIVKDNYQDFFSTDYQLNNLIELHTSGTSGSGLTFYMDKKAHADVWAQVWRGNNNIGLKRKTWCACFNGRPIVPKEQTKPPFYRVNRAGRQIMFSSFHLNETAFANYFHALNKYKPKWIQSYPSSLVPFAQYMIDNSLVLNYSIEIVTLSSESVTLEMCKKIEKAFGVYPIQNYAQVEAVATFRQRLDKTIYVDEDFSAVEFIDTGVDNLCRIVGTTLTNYAMPLLRYDTKDLATYEETSEGRKILTIDGRTEDYIKLKDGNIMRRLSRIFHEQTNISEAQIIQKSLDLLEIHVVTGKNYGKDDEKKLIEDVDSYLLNRISYKIIYDEEIHKTKSGKFKFIISEI